MMNKLILLFATACALASVASADNWALLVAGSNEYYNYRHQADICHAYQILHAHGIADDHIVVMMYDDIAKSKQNPTQGIIINRPNGPDVYKGVLKDYTGKDVTPKNFLNILQGNAAAMKGIGSGKVINSGPNDNVFVFFSDHGAPGLIAFPDGSALHASDLNNALQNMYRQKKYENMVVYIEACESGSMFENLLPPNINIYATTASNSEESSYACYYDAKRQTYLGDVYSVAWMEDSDSEVLSQETLSKQFQIVKKVTNTSHVQQFGNFSMADFFHVSDFQGSAQPPFIENRIADMEAILKDAVPTENARISILNKRLQQEEDKDKQAEISAELESVLKSYNQAKGLLFELPSIVYQNSREKVQSVLQRKQKLTNHACYKAAVDHLANSCLTLKNDYVLKHLYVLVNLCQNEISVEAITQAIDVLCKA